MNVTTIVLIPGLWLTALCWELWVRHYSSKGYRVVDRSWPRMEDSIEQLRRAPASLATLGLTEVVDHYEQIVRGLETPPIIIGHGSGGLITQILLDRGWGAAGVAIAPAPPKGIIRSWGSTLKLAFRAPVLKAETFHRDLANTLSHAQSLAAFDRYVVPGSRRVLRQIAFANFNQAAPSTVRFANDSRAPLLLVAGERDRVVPRSSVKANFDLYRDSKAETDYKEYRDQAHFTFLQEARVADHALGWALCHANSASTLAVPPNRNSGWSVQLST
jgi:pimeloyl-ACP methyl ester carboxylesterase